MPNRLKWIRCLGVLALVPAALTAMPRAASSRGVAFAEWRPQPATREGTPPAVNAKTWLGRVAEIEEYIRTAPIVRTEDVPRGVTRPTRAYFAPGGLVDSMVWKALRPGMSRGFYESYKSEIAAYEIDKLLVLDMVPPKVERRVGSDVGVAVMWVAPTRTFAGLGGVPKPPPAQAVAWNRQIVRAKMFQNLIGDIDPNLGNWLVDPAWNLILVDHSRALTSTTTLVHQMQRIDADLWTRMKAVTEQTLTRAVGMWIGQGEVRAILDRRDRMQTQIDKLVRARGEIQVFIR